LASEACSAAASITMSFSSSSSTFSAIVELG